MDKEFLRNTKLGIFVITGVILLIVGLYFIGSNKNMFGSTITIYTTFKNVSGLQNGNNVRYAGIDVGTVEKIVIINDTTIRIEMSLDQDLKKVIRKNSITSLGNDGLMGNKLINIDPGTPDAALIMDGDELSGVQILNTDEMIKTLEKTNQNVSAISTNLKNITENIDKSRGTLYTVLMDTTLAEGLRRTIFNIESTTMNLDKITTDLSGIISEVNSGKGLAGTLLKDTVMARDLQQTIKEVKSSSEQINASAAELKSAVSKINNGDGTLSTLINDTATANQLKRSISNIEKSTESFNENMEAMKHNFLFRGYFKRQEEINRKEQEKK